MPNDSHLKDCQNYGPFWGPYYNTGPNTGPNLGDPKKDHNFDNPPSRLAQSSLICARLLARDARGVPAVAGTE